MEVDLKKKQSDQVEQNSKEFSLFYEKIITKEKEEKDRKKSEFELKEKNEQENLLVLSQLEIEITKQSIDIENIKKMYILNEYTFK